LPAVQRGRIHPSDQVVEKYEGEKEEVGLGQDFSREHEVCFLLWPVRFTTHGRFDWTLLAFAAEFSCVL
jgi:hypothetical protein